MSNVELDDELLDPVSRSPSRSSPRRRRPALRSCSLAEGDLQDDGRREGRAEIGDSRGPYRLRDRMSPLSQHHSLDKCSFVVSFEIRKFESSNFVLLF